MRREANWQIKEKAPEVQFIVAETLNPWKPFAAIAMFQWLRIKDGFDILRFLVVDQTVSPPWGYTVIWVCSSRLHTKARHCFVTPQCHTKRMHTTSGPCGHLELKALPGRAGCSRPCCSPVTLWSRQLWPALHLTGTATWWEMSWPIIIEKNYFMGMENVVLTSPFNFCISGKRLQFTASVNQIQLQCSFSKVRGIALRNGFGPLCAIRTW